MYVSLVMSGQKFLTSNNCYLGFDFLWAVWVFFVFIFRNNSSVQFLTDKQVKADLRLTNEQWSSSLSDEKSQEFISLTGRIKNVVRMYIYF